MSTSLASGRSALLALAMLAAALAGASGASAENPAVAGDPSPRTPGTDEQALRQRAREYWEAELQGHRGTVLVRVEAALPHLARSATRGAIRTARLREAWERVDGTWYKRPIPRGFGR